MGKSIHQKQIRNAVCAGYLVLVLASSALGQSDAQNLTYRAEKTQTFDLIHTQLRVSFDWEKQHLLGEATLTLRPYFFSQEVLILDAKGMDIHQVALQSADSKNLLYMNDGKQLTISLGRTFERQDTLAIFIKYTAKPNERLTEGSNAIKSDKGLYFINPLGRQKNKPKQIWTQGETESNSVWFPTIESTNQRCTQEIAITVTNNFKTLSNGLLISQKINADSTRTDTWKMDQPHAPYLFMMAIGEFAIVEDTWQGISVNYYVEPSYKNMATAIFGHTPEMMSYFSELLGYPYPWPKYHQVVVRDFVSGAMENTTASVFMGNLQVDERELLDENWDDYIAHELFHQWFGDLVTCESWSNLTLNEGFANYSEYLWDEYKYGQDEADYNFLIAGEKYIDEAREEKKNLIRYFYDDREDMFDRHSYNKGGAVLHMLRNYMGDEAFFAGLQKYLADNAYQSVELADLRLAFEATIGEDLNWFFDQWYFFPGHPKLKISQTYRNDTLELTVEQLQLSEETPVFKLPVFVDVWASGEKLSYPIVVEEAVEIYQFQSLEKPDLVTFDAERQLLAEIDHSKSESEMLFQFKNGTRLHDRIEVMDSLYQFKNKKIVREVLASAFNDPFYVIRQYAIEFLTDNELKGKQYREAIAKLADDKNPHVRAAALQYFGETDYDEYKPIIQRGMNDPSYTVVGTAVTIIVENEDRINEPALSELKPINNLHVTLPLATYFIENRQDGSFTWFVEKSYVIKSSGLFYFNQLFAEFLIESSPKEKGKSIGIFYDMAMKHSNYTVRFSAYQALIMMTDIAGVNEKLKQIQASEKDDRLIKLYNEN